MRQSFALLAASTAWSWTPINSPVTGIGTISWSLNGQPVVDCNVSLTGQTAARGAMAITSLTFTDTGDGTCSNVTSPLQAYPQRWNPVLSHFARWGNAKFYLGPKGLRCYGNTGMQVAWPDQGGDTIISIDANESSGAGTCHVTATIDIGAVTIASTPPN
jgi:hypothetical protein